MGLIVKTSENALKSNVVIPENCCRKSNISNKSRKTAKGRPAQSVKHSSTKLDITALHHPFPLHGMRVNSLTSNPLRDLLLQACPKRGWVGFAGSPLGCMHKRIDFTHQLQIIECHPLIRIVLPMLSCVACAWDWYYETTAIVAQGAV